MTTRKRIYIVLGAALLTLLIGCSPEDGRQRGAGLGTGADIDNRPANFAPGSKVFTSPEGDP